MTIEDKQDPLDATTWQRILTIWRSEVGSDIELFDEGLFTNVKLHDPKKPTGREPNVTWWETAQVEKLTARGQKHFDEHPGSTGYVEQSYTDPKGPRLTVSYLWSHRQSTNDVAAILCCASLFSTMNPRYRNQLEGRRAPHNVQFDVYRAAVSQWHEPGTGSPWFAASASALPDLDFTFREVLDVDALAADLAREHLALLRVWRPIVITYEAER